jgi:hypothetical protein
VDEFSNGNKGTMSGTSSGTSVLPTVLFAIQLLNAFLGTKRTSLVTVLQVSLLIMESNFIQEFKCKNKKSDYNLFYSGTYSG